jgi:energy-coupling factor transporter ATP-binding protein EcfA2
LYTPNLKVYLSKPGRGSQTGENENGLPTYNSAMLKRLYIDNFRCFVNFEYKPERKQLLLGANGSGKSSLLEAVRLLKEFIKGRDIPFTQSSRTRWQDRPLQVFEIEALVDGKLYSYRAEILYASKSNTPSVSLERLSVEGVPAFELVDGYMRSYSWEEGKAQTVFLRGEARESSLHLASFGNPSVRLFVEWMDKLHCFKIDAYEGRMEEASEAACAYPDYEMEEMASWYSHLIAVDPDGNDAFRASMKEAISGFMNLRFSSEDDGVKKLRADFSSPEGKLTISLSELSDGQRCLIALYMILHFLIAKGHTVFLDEPDNFISLREIQPWLLAAEEAVEDSKGQLILISHHPEILNYWAREYGLLFSREGNGHVRTKAYREVADTGLDPAETIARGWENE